MINHNSHVDRNMAKIKPSNTQDINAFLEFGYIPEAELSIPEKIINASKKENLSGNLIKKGSKALTATFRRAINETSSSAIHIVPLSGGLDSRTILAGLLEHVDSSRIKTVTFGTPGTWDFKYGKKVASKAGVQNKTIDLTENKECWSAKRLQSYASDSVRPIRLFERAVNAYAHEIISNDHKNIIRWSGYLGDPLAGAHLKPISKKPDTWKQATDDFITKNRMTTELSHPDFAPADMLPDRPKMDRLEYSEQLDYGIRQPYFIKPVVMFPKTKTPFLMEEWVNFILRIPREQRLNRKLYRQIVLNKYPELFSEVPTDSAQGLKLTSPAWKKKSARIIRHTKKKVADKFGISYTRRSMNYIDFESVFRKDMRQIVENQLESLSERNIVDWIDIDRLKSAHMSGKDKSNELRLLIALEMYLKEGGKHSN